MLSRAKTYSLHYVIQLWRGPLVSMFWPTVTCQRW